MHTGHKHRLLRLLLAFTSTLTLGPGGLLASANDTDSAQVKGSHGKRRAVSIDDLLSLRNGFDAEIAPDGSRVAFAIAEPPKDYSSSAAPVANLWLVSTNTSQSITRFTTGSHMDWSPHWSPDNKRIAFLSSRTGNGRVYVQVVSSKAGSIALTPADVDVSEFAWAPDGHYIAFVAADASRDRDYSKHAFARADESVISRKNATTRLFVVDLLSKRIRSVSDPKVNVLGFAWSPRGDRIAVQVRDVPEMPTENDPSDGRAIVATVSPNGGKLSSIAEIRGALGTIQWSPDGLQIAMVVHESNAYAKFMRTLELFPATGGGAPRKLLGDYAGSVSEFAWTADNRRIVFVGAEGVNNCVRIVDAPSGMISHPLRASAIEGLSLSRATSRMAFFDESPLGPRDIWLTDLKGGARQLTNLNPQVRGLYLPKAELVRWVADDGVTIEGILLKPASSENHAPLPMVVMPHGGVTGWSRWKLGFQTDVGQVMAANYGYAVLYPNPRGTPGYGAFFEDQLANDVGGRELQDILEGIDYLVKEGIADNDRLAIGGWSWGGTLAAWAVARTDRFRCAIDGGGVVDWASFFGQTDFPAIASRLFGGTPYQRGDLYRERSTISHVESIHTPLLVLHGELDTHVPTGQGWEIYRALAAQRKDVEFVIYPREHEYLLEPAHARNFMNRVLEWYELHLKDTATPVVTNNATPLGIDGVEQR
jgi:dipeptidyl aminopeptidase/acylaminoacyl peptidase